MLQYQPWTALLREAVRVIIETKSVEVLDADSGRGRIGAPSQPAVVQEKIA
jgi:hypothetical protein